MGEPVIHLCRHAARAYLGGTMNHNIITVGSRTFTGEDLKSGSCYIAESIAGEELSIDTLDATVESAVDLTGLPYGEAVTYTHDNVLIGKFFLSSVKRVGASIYDLSCVSAVGLLAGSMHLGGLYTGQTAAVVLADIIGGMAEYTVDDKVKSVKVYGWLPYATRRDNLHQLLFAVGASITKTVAGTLNIKYLTANDPKFISTDRLYAGGSIDHSTPATEAQVTEHVYFASANDQTNTLFDNTDGSGTANNQLVTFDGPHHNLTASSGLTIVSSGVNHAVLTGTGTLTGKAYSHQTKIISKQAEAPAGTEHVVSVRRYAGQPGQLIECDRARACLLFGGLSCHDGACCGRGAARRFRALHQPFRGGRHRPHKVHGYQYVQHAKGRHHHHGRLCTHGVRE